MESSASAAEKPLKSSHHCFLDVLLQNGTSWMSKDCKKIFVCRSSQVKTDPTWRGCGSNAVCRKGKCRCKEGYRSVKKTKVSGATECRGVSTDATALP